jgi:Ca2+-binding EF-hand superfamily protein
MAALFAATLTTAAWAEKGPGGMLLERFDSIDADKDGKITPAEMDAHRLAEFAAADTNSDGLLSTEELTQKTLARMAEMAAERTTKMIAQLDTNDDGSLSAEEMDERVRDRHFARVDRDDDGAISKAEAAEALEHFAQRRKRHGKAGGDEM